MGDTLAPPSASPFSPASSISLPAKCPSGLLNTLPALGHWTGCFSFRSLLYCRILLFIPSMLSVLSPNTADRTISGCSWQILCL
jgi:hypothetical protein